MAATERKAPKRKQAELKEVTKGLSELESMLLKHLDLLAKGILNEQEFAKANEFIGSQKDALEDTKLGLTQWLDEQEGKVSSAEKLPAAIRSSTGDFGTMDVQAANSTSAEDT